MQSAQTTVCSVLSIMQVALVILTKSAQQNLNVKGHIYIYIQDNNTDQVHRSIVLNTTVELI